MMAGDPAGHLHPRPPRVGAALAPVAVGGELRRIPPAAPGPGDEPARHRVRAGHHHPRPGRGRGAGARRRPRRRRRAAGGGPGNAEARGDTTTEFGIGDVYDLDLPDDSVDVVHAHQVLQHLSDPVAALREMRRVCRPGGLVAVRDADYAAMVWYPASARLDDWLTVYEDVARSNDAEPSAARHLLAWAHTAGFEDVTSVGEHLVLRDAGGAGLVGWPVGRPDHPVVPGATGARAGARHAGARSTSWPAPGASGRRTRTGGSSSSTARSSRAPDRPGRHVGQC